MDTSERTSQSQRQPLKRVLSLPLVVLYGLGTTIGAGIYVLVGKVAERAGMMAPWSFMAAALLSAFTALTFAELSSRFPKSAGEAVYVKQAFNLQGLAVFVGILVILNGSVSAAALANGFVGYWQTFIAMPDWAVIVLITAILGLLAAWGIGQSTRRRWHAHWQRLEGPGYVCLCSTRCYLRPQSLLSGRGHE
jgi:amino acid transporter